MNAWPLLGVAVIALGFVLRFNPVLVVVTAAIASGLLSGMSVPDLLALLGTSFASSRILLIIVMTLPAIGLMPVQRYGANLAMPGAKSMLCGYCGTLLTPMAPNFKPVQAVLLELRSTCGVIRAQVATALVPPAVNLALMVLLVSR